MIEAANLIYPTGEIRAAWFPDEDLAGNLDAWIAEGYANAAARDITDDEDEDDVARSFGYWRAYTAKAYQIAGTPDSVKVEDLARTTSTGRAKFFLDRATYWRLQYEAFLAGAAAEVSGVSVPPRSGYAMTNVVRF